MPPTRPEQPIRMLALDLDNTLLRSDRTVSPRTIEALREVSKRGIEIVLASGRMLPAMERTAEALGLDLILVSYNGAAVNGRAGEGRKRLLHRPLDCTIARELYEFARERRFQVNFYLDDVIVSEDAPHLRPWIEIYRQRTGSPYRFVESLSDFLHHAPTKLLLVMDPAERDGLAEHFRVVLGERAVVLRTDPEYLEFLDPGADKGRAVRFVAESLGIAPAQIMAMGDGENDIPMLHMAGWPVAVANASAACKQAAKAQTAGDHNQDAVAEAIERWIL